MGSFQLFLLQAAQAALHGAQAGHKQVRFRVPHKSRKVLLKIIKSLQFRVQPLQSAQRIGLVHGAAGLLAVGVHAGGAVSQLFRVSENLIGKEFVVNEVPLREADIPHTRPAVELIGRRLAEHFVLNVQAQGFLRITDQYLRPGSVVHGKVIGFRNADFTLSNIHPVLHQTIQMGVQIGVQVIVAVHEGNQVAFRGIQRPIAGRAGAGVLLMNHPDAAV